MLLLIESPSNATKQDKSLMNIPKRPNVQPPGGASGGIFSPSVEEDPVSKMAQKKAYQLELEKQVGRLLNIHCAKSG